MKRCVLPIVFVMSVALSPRLGSAQVILVGCTSGLPGPGGQPTNRLVDVDPTTGAVSNSRDLGIPLMTGIVYDRFAGQLYGLTSGFSNPIANSLVQIDPISGAVTTIGPTSLSFIVEGDIAFNPIDGQLYGIQDIGPNGTQNNLFRINPTTGAATIVGNTNSQGDLSSLAFDNNGVLYTIDSSGMGNSLLHTVNPNTGTIVATISLNMNLGSAVGMTFHPDSGDAYVGDNIPSLASGGNNSIFNLNPTTGNMTLIGATGDPFGISGLTFVTVPEPSSFLLVGSGAVSFWRWRRRKVVG